MEPSMCGLLEWPEGCRSSRRPGSQSEFRKLNSHPCRNSKESCNVWPACKIVSTHVTFILSAALLKMVTGLLWSSREYM